MGVKNFLGPLVSLKAVPSSYSYSGLNKLLELPGCCRKHFKLTVLRMHRVDFERGIRMVVRSIDIQLKTFWIESTRWVTGSEFSVRRGFC
jgi:hypothetical protein